jgi:hypothetical protein
VNPTRADEILVTVADSASTPHANDSRTATQSTGLGTGTIGLVVDLQGAPVGYHPSGGSSTAPSPEVKLGRLQ